jgi:glycosyltransferase involved in cell wall biosynthesis
MSLSGREDGTRLRVAFVNTHPIQYFAPMYAYLQRERGIDVTALYLSDFSLRGAHDPGFRQAVKWDIDLLAGYEAKFIGPVENRPIGGFFSVVGAGLWSEIHKGRYDAVVIHGHALVAHHVALAACRSAGTPVFMRGETHLRLKRAAWKESVRTPLIASLFKTFDAFLAIGTANARYYRAMGVPADRIFSVPYTVDNERFVAQSQITAQERAETRGRLGVTNDAPAILYAAKFDLRKHPDDLVAAFAKLQAKDVNANLVLVGSGAMEADLRAKVAQKALRNVSFPGFVNQAELPRVYAACDVFVLPSTNEPWGLAVNEAMCAGLPIVLSDEIGCAEDLVQPGVNGAYFNAGDVDGLAAALRPIVTDADLRARYGAASRARIANWSYAECAAGLRAAIDAVKARRQRAAA